MNEAVPPLLRTSRLDLRDLTLDDFAAVHAYASDPEVVRYMPWGPNTEQDTRDFLERAVAMAGQEPRRDWQLAVVDREDDALLGAAGLHADEREHQAMLGYCYHPRAWGRGIATEVAEILVGFGFEVLDLHRVWAGCDPDNTLSARVLEKVGMTLEGRLREDTLIRGEPRDTLVYGILSRDWRQGREK